jgi:hypothetical protein
VKPHGYTHRESGDNFLLGVALLEAWRRQDQHAFSALLATESDLYAAVVAVCRVGTKIASYLAWSEQQIDHAYDAARAYGAMLRDDLGGDPAINESNKKE